MRTMILLSSILLLSAAWAGAQSGSSSGSQSDANSYPATVEGCLAGANGSYTLTDQAGTSYRLAGNLETLQKHVGETLRITGTETPVVHVPGAMSEGTESRPALLVESYERVSGVCSQDNSIH